MIGMTLALFLSAGDASAQSAFDETAAPGRLESVAIAPPAEALTFATATSQPASIFPLTRARPAST